MDGEDQGNTTTATAPAATPAAAAAPAPAPAAAAPAPAASGVPAVESDTSADDTRIPLEQMKADSWGTRVYHGVLSALGGSNDIALARDPATGKMVATAVKSGPGQQWKRIISGAITGAAAAAAGAGTGPGAPMRGFGLGTQATTQKRKDDAQQKRENANEDYEAQQKAVTSQAQNALLSHQIAASSFGLQRSQVEASYADADREKNFVSTIADGGDGSQDLGVFPDFPSVLKAFKEMPVLHDHQAGGRLITTLHVDGNGKIDGVHAALVTPDWLSSKINKDVPITVKQMADGKLKESTFTIPAGSLTGDQYSKLVMGQSKDALDEYTKQQDEEHKKKELENTKSRTAAENAASYASAAESNAKATQTRSATTDSGTVDLVGRGQLDAGRMAYLLARNPQLVQQVADKYPGFDTSKVGGYANAVKEFTSSKSGTAGAALNAGGTVLNHLSNLVKLNTVKSHIPGTPDWNAYHNQLDTVVDELAKFYGNNTVSGREGYRETLGSNLPHNRQRAILTQAHSMTSKFDSYIQTWKNAAPSKAYEAKMPGISPQAIEALKTLDPLYPESQVAELVGQQAAQNLETGNEPPPAAPAGIKVQPGEPTAKGANGETLVVRNGKWVTAQP